MREHTPGPWTYFVGNANGRGLIRIETAHDAPRAGIHIASMSRDEQSLANAHLLAAAWDAPHYCTNPACKGGQLMRELENLTPGGGEYVGDVARCIESIKSGKEMAAKLHRKTAERLASVERVNAELLGALKFVNEHCQLYGAADAAREKIDTAIARAEGGQS